MHPRPLIGVAVIIKKDGKILLGKRKNAHGAGTWQLPGGHLEFYESIEDCARREVIEETNIRITDLSFGPYTNDIFYDEQKHYVTLYVLAAYQSGPLQRREPEKCEKWDWFSWDDLPEPQFLPLANLKESGFDPFS